MSYRLAENCISLVVVLVCAANVALASVGGADVLERTLESTPLSARARNAIAETIGHEITLKDLVRVDRYLFGKKSQAEIETYLKRVGLDFSVNEAELTAFRQTGRLPKISLESQLGRLGLSLRAHHALNAEHIMTVGDLTKLS